MGAEVDGNSILSHDMLPSAQNRILGIYPPLTFLPNAITDYLIIKEINLTKLKVHSFHRYFVGSYVFTALLVLLEKLRTYFALR